MTVGTRVFLRSAASVWCVLVAAEDARCQAPATGLETAPARLDHEFTKIAGLRELPDGRVLIADEGEAQLYLVDWQKGTVQSRGREGRGPGEYRAVGQLHAVGADSTLLTDSRNGRWMVLAGDRIVGTIEYGRDQRRELPVVTGTDARGRLLVSVPTHLRTARGDAILDVRGRADSILLLRLDPRSGEADTIGRVRGSYRGLHAVSRPLVAGGSPIGWLLRNPLAAEEQALLFPDGWIALALVEPYRVDWIGPDGRRRRGAPLPFDRVPVDQRQKAAAVARAHSPQAGWTPDDMPQNWPEVVPPFMNGALFADPAGRLVVRRTPLAGASVVDHDIVDRTGRLVRRVALPNELVLVGFGRADAYLIRTDESGVQWLHRLPWP